MESEALYKMHHSDNGNGGTRPEYEVYETVAVAHIGWIYNVARRQLRDTALAEDAVQAVLLALWQKRRYIFNRNRPIGGWLAQATYYACSEIRKSERRRKNRERKVAAMRSKDVQSVAEAAEDSDALQLLALDAAMHKLSTGDRDVLVARYFQNQSARQMAQAFNISEAAAEKRITRAVIKLRGIMAHKNIAMDSTALATLLSSGAGTAPNGLLAKVLQGVSGKTPISLTAAHAARSIAFHSAHIPAIVGAAAVALAVSVAAVAPLAIKARQAPAKPVPAEITPLRQVAAANSTTAQSGVLTCVAYEMLVQRDFAWAIKTGGKLLSGKPGGVKAYDISARVVRALARAMIGRREVLLGDQLHWISTAARIRPWPIVPLYLRHTFYLAGSGDGFIANTSLKLNSPSVRTYSKFARVPVSFLAGSKISASFVRKPNNVPIPYDYQNTLNIHPGHVVVLLKHVGGFQGNQWYSVVVFDVERYPYHEVNNISTLIGVRRYIRVGPAGLKHMAGVATAWNRYAMTHPPKPVAGVARWTKSLPSGAVVTLVGIASGTWPLCQWSPDGAPAGRASEFLNRGRMIARFYIRAPNWHNQNHLGQSFPGPWAGYVEGNPIPGRDKCTVGLDSGKWQIIGTAKPAPAIRIGQTLPASRDFSFMGHRFGVYNTVAPRAHRIYLSLFMARDAPDMSSHAIAVGAINRNGKLISPAPCNEPGNRARFTTSPATAIGEYGYETIPISPNNVKRYVWITRPRHWVTFSGFAMQPSPLPSTVFASQKPQVHAITTKPTGTAKPIARIAANQTTPAGLMVLLGRALRSGNPLDFQKLAYAPTSAERHLLAETSNLEATRNAYGVWAEANKRFGIAQMRAAGLGEVINNIYVPDFPKHWKIKGAHAAPRLPLPHGVSWPAKGQPLHSLIEKNGLWYLNYSLTKAQIAQFNEGMRRSGATASPKAKAYHAIMRQLQAGKIKDAYALRDALAAALKKYSTPRK